MRESVSGRLRRGEEHAEDGEKTEAKAEGGEKTEASKSCTDGAISSCLINGANIDRFWQESANSSLIRGVNHQNETNAHIKDAIGFLG